MIYGFAIDGSLYRPILERARAWSESVTKAHVLYAHVCVDARESTSTRASASGIPAKLNRGVSD